MLWRLWRWTKCLSAGCRSTGSNTGQPYEGALPYTFTCDAAVGKEFHQWLWVCSAATGPMPKNVGFVLSTTQLKLVGLLSNGSALQRCIDATFDGHSPEQAHASSRRNPLFEPGLRRSDKVFVTPPGGLMRASASMPNRKGLAILGRVCERPCEMLGTLIMLNS